MRRWEEQRSDALLGARTDPFVSVINTACLVLWSRIWPAGLTLF